MRARFAIAVLLVVMFVFAMLMSPAAGQTAISPEATVEPEPPLPVVLQRPYHCVISPDGALAAIPNDGVYNLADGSLRFALPVRESNPMPSISFIASDRLYVSGLGIFDLDTGERLIEMISPMAGGNQRWLVTPRGIYNLRTGEKVYDMLRERLSGRIADIWMPPDSDYAFVLIEKSNQWIQVLLNAPTGEILLETKGSVVSPDESRVAVFNDGLYIIGQADALADFPEGDYGPIFSPDSRWLALQGVEHVLVYDATTGEYLGETAILPKMEMTDVTWADNLLLITGRDMSLVNPDGSISNNTFHNSVYEFPSGELLFTHDGQIRYLGGAREAWLDHDRGVFDPLTGEILLAPPISFYRPVSNGRAIRFRDGEYDIDTWEKVYDYPDGFIDAVVTDADYRYALVERQGVFDAQTGEKLMTLPVQHSYFTPDGQFLVTSVNRRRCSIYRLPEREG